MFGEIIFINRILCLRKLSAKIAKTHEIYDNVDFLRPNKFLFITIYWVLQAIGSNLIPKNKSLLKTPGLHTVKKIFWTLQMMTTRNF